MNNTNKYHPTTTYSKAGHTLQTRKNAKYLPPPRYVDPDDWDLELKSVSLVNHTDDTTQHQATNLKELSNLYGTHGRLVRGRDIQSIDWGNTSVTSRAVYRNERIRQYDNYSKFGEVKTLVEVIDKLQEEASHVEDNCCFYRFRQNVRSTGCALTHFQLRHLLASTSKHDVYHMDDSSIYHWNASCGGVNKQHGVHTKIIDLKNDPLFGKVMISSLAAMDHILICGGFKGELICVNLETKKILYKKQITTDANAIINCIHLTKTKIGFEDIGSEMKAIISCNDSTVRIFDIPSFTLLRQYSYSWPVNHCTISPCGKKLCVVGDDDDCFIIDPETGKQVIPALKGHMDFSFASAWHPFNQNILVTGAQDKTIRIWDIRMPKQSVKCIMSFIGAVRSLQFSSDGKILAAAECADFVHLYDAMADYSREQQLDIFGEISGISFTPNNETFFAGIYDRTYKSLMEFSRVNHGSLCDEVVL